MAISKVILNGTTLIDLTDDNVTASDILSGKTAHKNDGTEITGTLSAMTTEQIQSAVNAGWV